MGDEERGNSIGGAGQLEVFRAERTCLPGFCQFFL
jgi:hypothetical protein